MKFCRLLILKIFTRYQGKIILLDVGSNIAADISRLSSTKIISKRQFKLCQRYRA